MRRAIVSAWCLLLLATGGAQAATVPDVALYRHLVHNTRLALDSLPASGTVRRVDQDRVILRLESLSRVRLPNGRVLVTNLPALGRELRSNRSAALEITRRLDTVDDALGGTRLKPFTRGDLAALDDVLRDSRFHPLENPVQRFFDWLGGQIDRLLNAITLFLLRLVPGAPNASFPNFIFAVVFLVVVAGAAVLIARAALRRAISTRGDEGEADEPRTSVAAQERVDRHLAEGDYRLALRYLLLSTLLQLQERGALRLRPGLTNREYLRELERALEGNIEVARPMGEIIDTFDRTWYGHLPIDQAEYERCRTLAGEAMSAAQRFPAA